MVQATVEERTLARVEALPGEGGPADAELVRRARAGDGWALEKLYRRHVERVAATALRLLRRRDEAEDVTQETFLIAFEQLDRLAEPAAFRGWLLRIAVSRVHRRFRFRRLWRVVGRGGGEDPAEDTLLAEASPEATPEQRVELALLDRALATLPERLREPWVLRHVVRCSNDECAAACRVSLATVKRRIAEADARIAAHTGRSA